MNCVVCCPSVRYRSGEQLFNKWLLEHRVNNCWELWYDGEHEARAGRAGIGVLLRRPDGSVETTLSKCIPTATPAEAEYKALIAGLVEALRRNAKRLVAHGEKEVVTEQVNGSRRLEKRDAHTVPLYATVVQLAKRFKDFKLERVDVEDNGKAHLLAMRALKGIRR